MVGFFILYFLKQLTEILVYYIWILVAYMASLSAENEP
jgi:hypothetical protein